eukprot:508855-Rhodomonas_salina.1
MREDLNCKKKKETKVGVHRERLDEKDVGVEDDENRVGKLRVDNLIQDPFERTHVAGGGGGGRVEEEEEEGGG